MEKQFNNLQEQVRHGDSMLPFAQYVSWLPGTFTLFSMHWHKEVEIIYVQSGCCELNIDLQRYVIKEGDIVLVHPYSVHSFKQYEKEDGCLFTWVFDLSMLSSGITDACYVKYLKPFIDGKIEYPPILNSDYDCYDSIRELLLELHGVCDKKEPFMELNVKWRLEKLFFLLFQNVFKKKENLEEQKQEAIENIKIVVDYIQENYQNPLNIQELAGLLHFSEPYFMRFFKKHTGTTCVDFINGYRLNKSIELLGGTGLSIMEIAMQVGMHNISYFNRLFKKKYQMTPKEYRKNMQKRL